MTGTLGSGRFRPGPFLAEFGGATFVIKIGGEILALPDRLGGILADVVELQHLGIRTVVVHGGGPQADALARAMGHRPRKVGGRRITTETDLEIAKLLYGGSLNLDILAALAKLGARGIRVSGLDGGLIAAERRPPMRVADPQTGAIEEVDFGLVGDIRVVDTRILELLLAHGYVPVVAPLAGDGSGAVFNINADTVACEVAKALGARKLILLSNVPGILDDRGEQLPVLDPRRAEALLAAGAFRGGMLPKVQSALDAVAHGVECVHVIDGTHPHSLLLLAAGTLAAGTGRGRSVPDEAPASPGTANLSDGPTPANGPTRGLFRLGGVGTVVVPAAGEAAHV